jgi:hypothetical protein
MERAASVEEEPRVANQRANSIPVLVVLVVVEVGGGGGH